MLRERLLGNLLRAAVGMGAAGMLFGVSCSAGQLRALAAAVNAATSEFNEHDDNDISFGDWLLNELEDL